MGTTIPAGPFDHFKLQSGETIPFYLVPFDKQGTCEGPKTLEHLLADVKQGNYTDVHIFSHGWNNVFKDAVSLYKTFFDGYFAMRSQNQGGSGHAYRPLVIGILWPSTALVSGDDKTPQFAAATGVEEQEYFALQELTRDIGDADARQLMASIDPGRPLTRDEALEVARILLPIFNRPDTEAGTVTDPVTPEELLEVWRATAMVPAPTNTSGAPGALPDDDGGSANPQAAGVLDFFNPKQIVRVATVYQMKDRAATVGAHGVGPMLRDILASTAARVHLMGHSYGAKVMLSALSVPAHSRKVASVLLLQPAVSYLCFAADANGKGQPGGYRRALDLVERPILSTFSSHDSPLTRVFHLALRRPSDVGDQKIAAGPPNRYAALGGFGPGGTLPGESKTIAIHVHPGKYPRDEAGVKIYGVDGSDNKIMGHGDVTNQYTQWALVNLVSDDSLA